MQGRLEMFETWRCCVQKNVQLRNRHDFTVTPGEDSPSPGLEKTSSPMRRHGEVELFGSWNCGALMRLGAKEIHWTSVGEREGDAGELSGRKRVYLQKVLGAFQ